MDKYRLYSYGQYLVRRYHEQLLSGQTPEAVVLQPLPLVDSSDVGPDVSHQPGRSQLPPPVSILHSLGAASASSPLTGAGTQAELRIVFQKRDGEERQLINMAELVEQCNQWEYTAPLGAHVHAVCVQVRDAACRSLAVAARLLCWCAGCAWSCCFYLHLVRQHTQPPLLCR